MYSPSRLQWRECNKTTSLSTHKLHVCVNERVCKCFVPGGNRFDSLRQKKEAELVKQGLRFYKFNILIMIKRDLADR